MITDKTLDEALVELMRTKRALEALRAARKQVLREQLADMYKAKPGDGNYSEADIQTVRSCSFRSPYRRLSPLHAAAKRSTLDLTRKLAQLRASK